MKKLILIIVLSIASNFCLQADEVIIDTVWTQEYENKGEVKDLEISPDGQFVYAAVIGSLPMKLSVETGEIIQEYEGMMPYSIYSGHFGVELSNDGNILYSGHLEEFAYSWNTQTGEMLGTFDPQIEPLYSNFYHSLTLSDDYLGALIMYQNYDSDFEPKRKVVIWDRNTREIVHSEINSTIEEIEFSNSGNILVYQYNQKKQGKIGLINTIDWSTIHEFPGHNGITAYDISFSPDDSRLATCSHDGKINIYDVNNKSFVDEIIYPDDIFILTNVLFSDDSKYLMVLNYNFKKNYLKIFETESYNIENEFNFSNGPVTFGAALSISQKTIGNENIVITGNEIGIIKFKVDGVNYINSMGKQSNNIIIPNPNNSTANIELTIEKPESIEISIINSAGIEIEEIHSGALNQGKHSFLWDGGNFPSGIYYCRIKGKNTNETLQIILEK
jgi:WD40 repeat protein